LHYRGKTICKGTVRAIIRETGVGVSEFMGVSLKKPIREVNMLQVKDIQTAIENLPRGEYARLRQWFAERDWAEWDKQIEADAEAGKLDFLIKEALAEIAF
jgi:hypothetical protein